MPRPKKVFIAPLQISSTSEAGNSKIQSSSNQIKKKNGKSNNANITKNHESKRSSSTNRLNENENVQIENVLGEHHENKQQNYNVQSVEFKINGKYERGSFHIDLTKNESHTNNNNSNQSEDEIKSASDKKNGKIENVDSNKMLALVPENNVESEQDISQSTSENKQIINSVPNFVYNTPLLENWVIEAYNKQYNFSQNEVKNNQQTPLSPWENYATKLPDSSSEKKKIVRKRKITNKLKETKSLKEITMTQIGRPKKSNDELTNNNNANGKLYEEDLQNKIVVPVLRSSEEQLENTSFASTSTILSGCALLSSCDFLSKCSGISKDSKKTARKRLYTHVNCDNLPSIGKSLRMAERNIIKRGLMSQDCQVVKPPQGLSQSEKLLWLQENRTIGLWVECCHCKKWRYLKYIVDPLEVPKIWYCYMNADLRYDRCSVEQCPYFSEEDLIENAFTAGSIVWAKLTGYPWWPAMVDDNPEFLSYYWPDPDNRAPTVYNVTFFDTREVSRIWLDLSKIKKFNQVNAKNYIKSQPLTYKYRLLKSIMDANTALSMPVQKRLSKFSFVVRFKGPIYSYKHNINKFVEENNLPLFVDISPSGSQVSDSAIEDEANVISDSRIRSSQNYIFGQSPASTKGLRNLENKTEVSKKLKGKIKEMKSNLSPRNISKTKATKKPKKSVSNKTKSIGAKKKSYLPVSPKMANNGLKQPDFNASQISHHCSQLYHESQTSQKSVSFNKVLEYYKSSSENEERNTPQDSSQNIDDNSPKNYLKIEQKSVPISKCEKSYEGGSENQTILNTLNLIKEKPVNECFLNQHSQYNNDNQNIYDQESERNEVNNNFESDNISLLTYEIVENINDSISNSINNKSLDTSKNLYTSLNMSEYTSFEEDNSSLPLKEANSENNANLIRPREGTSELFGNKADQSTNCNLFLIKPHFMVPLSSFQNNNNLLMSSPCCKFNAVNESISSKHSDFLNSSMTSYREKYVSFSQNTNILTQPHSQTTSGDSSQLDFSQEY